ncbi:ada2a-containing complex component 2 [Cotesia typhae]|uniref:ada2a-containing complex component 2 n=1 Tax=Cotesia typhae TaxID=2053667 RepID=UPI003D68C064
MSEESEDSSSDLQELKPTFCKYCSQTCDPYDNPSLKCLNCEASIHVRCLRRGGIPGGLIGDVFFDLTCQECHPLGEETLVRQKMSWLGIVILTLYNLRAKSAGISKRGYFHWNYNVNAFVEKNWDILFPKNVKQKKNWKGTISGALSHSSKKGQIFFLSGSDELEESGYWKLTSHDPPEVLIARNEQAINERKRLAKSHQVQLPQQHNQLDQSSINSSPVEESSSDSYGDSSRTVTPSMFSREYVQPSEILSDFLFADDEVPGRGTGAGTENQESDFKDKFVVKSEQDLNHLLIGKNQDLDDQDDANKFGMKKKQDFNQLIQKNQDLDNEFIVPDQGLQDYNKLVKNQDFQDYSQMVKNQDYKFIGQNLDLNLKNKKQDLSRLKIENNKDYKTVSVKNEPELIIDEENFDINMEQDLGMENEDDINIDLKSFGEDDLIKFVNTFNLNWMHDMLMEEDDDNDDNEDDGDDINSNSDSNYEQEPAQSLFTSSVKREFPWKKSNLKIETKIKMNKNEEEYLLSTVNKSWLDKMSPRIRRLYRKMAVRRIKRLGNMRLIDWDSDREEKVDKKEGRVIDRFRTDFLTARSEQRLMGFCEHGEICSPYTQRKLKPFIRRDDSYQPLWLKVMAEMDAKVNGKKENWGPRARSTVDFSYVRPQHIPGINSLACQFFWPGIDLTECLQYPDFTCVVLYKKLIIGFGILVPDIGFEESYISFFLIRPEWRKAGIGTFMLYHLIQTSMGKDVTLHVSATNPALILYQKFGFKIEQFVQDFYDKYMTTGAKESRHALFLRLSR